MTITTTLRDRNSRYGPYLQQAVTAMDLKSTFRLQAGWSKLEADQMDALDQFATKIARILNGDPNYIDNWHDIQGYAKLVEDRLQSEQQP